jgi:hypothetical protein
MISAVNVAEIPTFFNQLNGHNDPNALNAFIKHLQVTFSWRLFSGSRIVWLFLPLFVLILPLKIFPACFFYGYFRHTAGVQG